LHSPQPPELHLWHGFNRELAASIAVVVGGVGVAWFGHRTGWAWARIPRVLRLDALFDRALEGLGTAARAVTRGVGSDSPSAWLRLTLGFLVMLVAGALAFSQSTAEWMAQLGEGWSAHAWDGVRVLVAALIGLGALGAAVLRTWPAQLVSLSVSGFLTTVYYVLYRAPDLALTQILVETVALVLVVTLLARFPRSAQSGEESATRWTLARWGTLGVAVAFGGSMTLLGLLVTVRPHPDPIGPWFNTRTVSLAEGANAVNTLLIDFRGFDTLGEITVLMIAMLGCLGLLFRRRRTAAERREGPMGPAGLGVHHGAAEGGE
jgi:multisubunit Na+/H+ antiporter MnhB subunit